MLNVKEVKLGKTSRMSFAKIEEQLEAPDLIEVQKNSYNWFINEGIRDAFKDIFPITDFSERVSLEYVSHKIYQDEKKYYSFYRNEDDENNSWYYYNGTNSHKFDSEKYGIPVLLFYKKHKNKK